MSLTEIEKHRKFTSSQNSEEDARLRALADFEKKLMKPFIKVMSNAVKLSQKEIFALVGRSVQLQYVTWYLRHIDGRTPVEALFVIYEKATAPQSAGVVEWAKRLVENVEENA